MNPRSIRHISAGTMIAASVNQVAPMSFIPAPTTMNFVNCTAKGMWQRVGINTMDSTLKFITPETAQHIRALAATDRFEFVQDKCSKWRWRRVSERGAVLGTSSRGWHKRSECEINAIIMGMV